MHVLRYIVEPEAVWWPLTDALGPVQPELRIIRLKLWSFIAPCVELAFESASRCSLPLGFGWKSIVLAGLLCKPRAIRGCVEPTDAGDRLIEMIESRIVPAVWSLMICVFDEGSIEPIGNCEAPNGELVDEHSMNRAFILGAGIATHQKIARGDDNHFGLENHGPPSSDDFVVPNLFVLLS